MINMLKLFQNNRFKLIFPKEVLEGTLKERNLSQHVFNLTLDFTNNPLPDTINTLYKNKKLFFYEFISFDLKNKMLLVSPIKITKKYYYKNYEKINEILLQDESYTKYIQDIEYTNFGVMDPLPYRKLSIIETIHHWWFIRKWGLQNQK